ncbi:MAG: amino acid adenylation domain-containing protein, partial [Chitinophagaceae bacterium]
MQQVFLQPTVSQKLIWMDQAISGESAKYNIGGYARLEGDLQYEHLNAAISAVLKSQEVYSAIFTEENGELHYQVNSAGENYQIELLDLLGHEDPELEAIEWMNADFSKAFNLENQYLFRFKLIRINKQKHLWYAVIHHLIGDGWSFQLLLNQTAAFYNAFCKGQPLSSTFFKYSDYAEEDHQYYQSSEMEANRSYWLEEYKELPPALFSQQYHVKRNNPAGSETLRIDIELKKHLHKVAEANNVSLFHIIVGLLIVYFSRTTQQKTIGIGVPVLNRTKKVYRHTAGIFMNLLSLKFDIIEEDTFSTVLQAIKRKMSASLRHQKYQYGNLVKDLKLPQNRKLLHDIRVSYEDFDFTSDFGGLAAQAIALSNYTEVDPLAIYIREYTGQGFDIRFIYNTGYFTPDKIQSVCKSLQFMMEQLQTDTNYPVHLTQVVDKEASQLILALAAGAVRPQCPGFLQRWAQSVLMFPEQTGISFDGRDFTYEEIDKRARCLANRIISLQGGGPRQKVVILLPRSEKIVIGMLACMMAGATYVPVDPEYPEEQISYILKDAGCNILINDASVVVSSFNHLQLKVISVDDSVTISNQRIDKVIDDEDPCYIIYTSGSTGHPKGVVISYQSLSDYVATFLEYFSINEKDVVLQQASVGFDTSVEEIFPILAAGGRLHILEHRKDLVELKATLDSESITILSTNPWAIRFLDNESLPVSLRILISGGDVLKQEYIKNIIETGISVYNTYGPTESTVCASYYKVRKEDQVIPIGCPITNRKLYLLDEYLNLLPIGTEGEICIGGSGLALEYLNREELTKEKFVNDPFKAGEKLYRTGDIGIMLNDGNILFKGRKDHQVNFRGYRIETPEIETIINEQDGVSFSIVDVCEVDHDPLLVAYIKYNKKLQWSSREWRQVLAKRLPVHMIPDVWIELDELPLLPNGKVNRKELPVVDVSMLTTNKSEIVSPSTKVEKQMHRLWQTILKQQNISIDDSFFENGGHSLNIVQLIVGIKQEFNVRIGMHDVFERDTIRQQAELITRSSTIVQREIMIQPAEDDYPLSAAQNRMWILNQLGDAARAYHISGALELYGEINDENVQQAVMHIINRHESLRTIFIEKDGTVRQKIASPSELDKQAHSFISLQDNDLVDEVLREFIARPFQLDKFPLIRTMLLQTAPARYLFVYVMPHIISDGWSIEVLMREFVSIYTSLSTGRDIDLPTLKAQFKDYLHFLDNDKQVGEGSSEKYWLEKLSGKLPVIDFPAQFPRPVNKTYKGKEICLSIEKNHCDVLLKFCEKESATLFMGLFATLNLLIHRYTGQQDTIIGTPVANRDEQGMDNQVGLYLNMLPVRTKFNHTDTFRELIRKQKQELIESYGYTNYPMDELLQKLNYRNVPSRSPLFDMIIVLHNQQTLDHLSIGGNDCVIPGVQINVIDNLPKETSQFDMTFAFFYEKESLQLRMEYNTALYDDEFAKQVV